MKKQSKKILEELEEKRQIMNLESELSRARAITVGTAFGGVTEISMRGNNGSVLWCLMQPVEIMELIHQLSANIGCLIRIIPRQDFASWRDWKLTPEELEHYRGLQLLPGTGWPPYSNDPSPHFEIAKPSISNEEQPGIKMKKEIEHKGLELDPKFSKQLKEKIKQKQLTKEKNETLATKKNIDQ